MNKNAFYDAVAQEIKSETLAPGVWAKAYAESEGNVDKARALYIKFRVEDMAEAAHERESAEIRERAACAKKNLVKTTKAGIKLIVTVVVGLIAAFGVIAACVAIVEFFGKK